MEISCANCQAPLHGPFCSQCGQEHLADGLTLKRVLADAWEEVFKVDGRILATLRSMASRPGELTLEFFAGKRIRYVTPVKLYLTSSAVYFLVTNFGDVKHRIQQQSVFRSQSSSAEIQRVVDEVVKRSTAFFFDNLSTILIFAVPATALASALLFRGRKRTLLFHLVFGLHFWSAVFLVSSFLAAIQLPLNFFQLFFAVSLIYGLFALKRTFSATWLEATLKSVLFTYSVMLLSLVVFLAIVASNAYSKRKELSLESAAPPVPAKMKQ